MPLIFQPSAVAKKPIRRRYGPSVLAKSLFLPEKYRRKEEEEYQQGMEDLERERLALARAAIGETEDQTDLANLISLGNLGVSGGLGASKLLSLGKLGAATGGSVVPAAGATGATLGTMGFLGPSFTGALGPGGPSAALGVSLGAADPAAASALALTPSGAATPTATATGASSFLGPLATGVGGAAAVAAIPFLGKEISDYFQGKKEERYAKREQRALGDILPGMKTWEDVEPWVRGEVEQAAGAAPDVRRGSKTLGRLLQKRTFTEFARQQGWTEQLNPYDEMMAAIGAGRAEGAQRGRQFAEEMRLTGPRMAGERLGTRRAQVLRQAAPTFALDFGEGTATPTFPTLSEIMPTRRKRIGRG